jgi:hypothetical protein
METQDGSGEYNRGLLRTGGEEAILAEPISGVGG